MIKRLLSTISLILMLALLLSACSPGAAATGSARSADILHSLGLFNGTATGADGKPIFELERSPTRAEAVTMLVRLLGADLSADAGASPFEDVPAWAEPYVSYAWAKALTNGTGEKTFGPGSPSSATQYIAFVLRALGYSSEKDFRWDAAWELSDRLSLTNGQYSASSPFTREDAADISLAALYQPILGSGETLCSRLCASGAIKDAALARALLGDKAFNSPAEASSRLEVHFIDVGQADSILLLCDGQAMLIDGGNVSDSSLIYSYLKSHNVTELDYVVCTHAHEDHVGGLAGALNYAAAKKVFCPVTSYESTAFSNFLAALKKQNLSITVPGAGDSFALGGATVTVLAPIFEHDEVNNSSIVLRVDHGERSFLFMGDAELESEQEMLFCGCPVAADLIKIGHHGSESSTGYRLLYESSPQYAVISCGENNSYGHPDEAVMSRLRDAEVQVFRTDMQGNIVCISDGHALTITTEKNRNVETNPTAQTGDTGSQAVSYIGNVNSKIFHLPTCSSLPMEKNRVYFAARPAAVNAGYRPCGNCHP